MAEPVRLTASGVATLQDPKIVLDAVLDHFGEHGTVTRTDNGGQIDMIGCTRLSASGCRLEIALECPDEPALCSLKCVIAEHLFMFARGNPMELAWTDSDGTSAIPDLREVTVVRSDNVTPNMRRVTLAVDDVERYQTGGFHVRLLIPPRGRNPLWPHVGADGRIAWPAGEDELTVRIYTIRALDPVSSEIDIDIVLHEGNDTPGANWALNAQPGDRAGLLGPGGGGMPVAKRLLLAGDETALPAIARIAAGLDADADARIFIEIESEADRQPLPSAARIEPVWLYRNGRKAGTTGCLEALIREQTLDDTEADRFIWAATEQSEAAAIRHLLRQERGLDRKNHMIAAYWRRLMPDDLASH